MSHTIEITLTGQTTGTVISTGQGQSVAGQQATSSDQVAGILACLESGAGQLDMSIRALLKQTEAITLSVPDFVNETLTAENGSRIGLIVTKGYETTAYGQGTEPNPLVGSIVSEALVVGLNEATNEQGEQVQAPDIAEIKETLQHLLELGSGILVVSFKNAVLNPANERLLQTIMHADYPRHYLGAVPLLLASDFSQEQDDLVRTNTCLLNAYTWFSLDQTLRRIDTTLRQQGYNRSLLVAQNDGPAVPIPKVTPLKTGRIEQLDVLRIP
jgi:N-methylhydantoinase A/oxoprolinase/acetone carboxylase beta subunit